MKYIELPPSVNAVLIDTNGFYFFENDDARYLLKDIVEKAKNGKYEMAMGLQLTVTDNCPRRDQLYAEYLEASDLPKLNCKSTGWCKLFNGIQKQRDNERLAHTSLSWLASEHYQFLSPKRKEEIQSAREEQRDDRRQKGSKSF